jgi:hypothetical protein
MFLSLQLSISEWLLFNSKWEILQLHYGENKLLFNEMSGLPGFLVLANWNKSSDRHDLSTTTHYPNCDPVFAANINVLVIVFGLVRPTIFHIQVEHVAHYIIDVVL